MSLALFLEKINANHPVRFDETIAIIHENYEYQPAEFHNGLKDELLVNKAGTNEGSCKIFAFAQLNQLTQEQTLNLFGDYYQLDVLNNPQGIDHQNIRHFFHFGWAGISFKSPALHVKQ